MRETLRAKKRPKVTAGLMWPPETRTYVQTTHPSENRALKNNENTHEEKERRWSWAAGFTRNAGGAVDEDEDHAAEGPGDAEKSDAAAGVGLVLVADDGGDGDVEEEKGGDEFGDEGSVEGPPLELVHVDERRRRWVHVVLAMVVGLRLLAHFLRHFSTLLIRSLALSLSKKTAKKESSVSEGVGVVVPFFLKEWD